MSELCIFDANKNGIWYIRCAKIRNLAYLLRTKAEFGTSITHKDVISRVYCKQIIGHAYISC